MFEEDLLLQGPSEQNGDGRWHDVAQWRIGLIRGIRRRNGAVKRRSTSQEKANPQNSYLGQDAPQGEKTAAVFCVPASFRENKCSQPAGENQYRPTAKTMY